MMHPYEWPAGYTGAMCFTMDVDAESPHLWRSREQGIVGLNELEQRRFGMRQGLWRILDLLQRYGVAGSFYIPAYEATHYPEVIPALLEGGHEVGLHGYTHEKISDISPAYFEDTLHASMELLRRATGKAAVGFRSPSWQMTPEALEIIRSSGLLYDSSVSGYEHPYTLGGITEIPIQWPQDDAMFFRFVGDGGDRWAPVGTAEYTRQWLEALAGHHACGALFLTTVHPWVSGRIQRLPLVEAVLKAARAAPGLWLATAEQLARHHVASPNKERFAVSAEIPRYSPLA